MGKIKIRYKKRIQKWFFYFGLAWASLGFLMFFLDKHSLTGYFYLAMGIFLLMIYYYYNKKQYLTIKNGILTKNNMLLSKSIPLNEVKKIKYFAEDYTLTAGDKKLTISTYVIEKNSLEKLKAILNELNAEWEE